ncbi:hypothetical protein P171DRAFT_486373 [Karstenula rhodostoma CBS 690.94]|uniref:Uncharacterized protein n=1 Tax=Karstenula rhodostoma CBS 690.94 TaxID=1392251 RepID=A0A9P4PIT2_9PLEO|nr:hypothetical protein P171DRAFT_486373 [Karstenula rhodostoma CBS 690.94]
MFLLPTVDSVQRGGSVGGGGGVFMAEAGDAPSFFPPSTPQFQGEAFSDDDFAFGQRLTGRQKEPRLAECGLAFLAAVRPGIASRHDSRLQPRTPPPSSALAGKERWKAADKEMIPSSIFVAAASSLSADPAPCPDTSCACGIRRRIAALT